MDMKKYLELINKVIDPSLKGEILTYENLKSTFEMNIAASDLDIDKCRVTLEAGLPNDYEFFLRNFNGGKLFLVDDFAGFKLLGTEELINHNKFQQENFGEDWDKHVVLFCEIIGDAEYLGFKIDKEKVQIVFCIMDTLPSEWQAIDDTFDILIQKIILSNGAKYWI